jgi:2-aminoethylphosphonate-pyruvate transaminase
VDNDIPYLLLTPGPLTTSRRVREAMLRDYSTWDVDYNSMVNDIRQRLVGLVGDQQSHTCVLMQGSGTFSIEATVGSVVGDEGMLLMINNGAYGQRIATIAERLGIDQLLECIAEVLKQMQIDPVPYEEGAAP